jgi:hypothetical protein
MNNETAEAGIAAVHAFLETFNAQDHERHAQTLNYPHIRLANGKFARLESAEEFAERSRNAEPRLKEEGWHHTVLTSLEVLHAGEDKVHLSLRNDRCREDGTVYHSFDTLWIATLVDGHWGIQFRSSFLHAM